MIGSRHARCRRSPPAGRAGVGDHHGSVRRQPLIAGMWRMQQRRAGGIVVAQDRGDALMHGDAHAVEMRQAAVSMAEEAQRRQHALHRADQHVRRRFRLVGIGLAQRQQVGEQFHDRHRIAGDMPAIRQDLTFNFLGQVARRVAQRRGRRRQRQRGIGERDARPELAFASGISRTTDRR